MWYGWGGWYGYGFEYKSPTTIGGWPLVHVCSGFDPVTMRPRIAMGVVAIGNIAVGGLAIGGVACGVFAVGGVSLGLLLAVGGVALGLGLSIGGWPWDRSPSAASPSVWSTRWAVSRSDRGWFASSCRVSRCSAAVPGARRVACRTHAERDPVAHLCACAQVRAVARV